MTDDRMIRIPAEVLNKKDRKIAYLYNENRAMKKRLEAYRVENDSLKKNIAKYRSRGFTGTIKKWLGI